eukprot:CAMPEP_0171992734 /NCGR_PEP_ID=MMETSP0993-20121228/278078_1 /TAXON_ID=483369 /ORGANISM="non described non described, Strain CCMP2098" /LENGTH=1103 /DNA_ID=CAMNT_0012645781 /DNA_START=6 /DNA_END=3317 /DNA_ORIENTATION=-
MKSQVPPDPPLPAMNPTYAPVQWGKLEPPSFKRCFIEPDKNTSGEDDDKVDTAGSDGVNFDSLAATLPTAARAFLSSKAGEGYRSPTPVQRAVWPILFAGRDILCVAPTGSGKSMAYLVPALVCAEEAAQRWKAAHAERKRLLKRGPAAIGGRGLAKAPLRTELRFLGFSPTHDSSTAAKAVAPTRPACLVLVPTRELCTQVAKQASLVCRAKGLRCVAVMGGGQQGPQWQQRGGGGAEVKALTAPTPTHMMVATPGRLLELVETRKVDLCSVVLLVVDEADRVLTGSLQEQFTSLAAHVRPDVQAAFLSATIPEAVAEWAAPWLRHDPATVRLLGSTQSSSSCELHEQPLPGSRRLQLNPKKEGTCESNGSNARVTANGQGGAAAVKDDGDDADGGGGGGNEGDDGGSVSAQSAPSPSLLPAPPPSLSVKSALALPTDVAQTVRVVKDHRKVKAMLKWVANVRAAEQPLPSSSSSSSSLSDAKWVANVRAAEQPLSSSSSSSSSATSQGRGDLPVLVFCNKISTCEAVVKQLRKAEQRASSSSSSFQTSRVVLLHGKLRQFEREAALKAFAGSRQGGGSSRQGQTAHTLVATDVCARGLHLQGLQHVLNYDFPPSLEQYLHRIGRVGRLGQQQPQQQEEEEEEQEEEQEGPRKKSRTVAKAVEGGVACSFFTKSLTPLAPALAKLLQECGQPVDPALASLAAAAEAAAASSAAVSASASSISPPSSSSSSSSSCEASKTLPAATAGNGSGVDIAGMVAALLGGGDDDDDEDADVANSLSSPSLSRRKKRKRDEKKKSGDPDNRGHNHNHGGDNDDDDNEEEEEENEDETHASERPDWRKDGSEGGGLEGECDEEDSGGEGLVRLPVGYTLPPWLRNKTMEARRTKAKAVKTKHNAAATAATAAAAGSSGGSSGDSNRACGSSGLLVEETEKRETRKKKRKEEGPAEADCNVGMLATCAVDAPENGDFGTKRATLSNDSTSSVTATSVVTPASHASAAAAPLSCSPVASAVVFRPAQPLHNQPRHVRATLEAAAARGDGGGAEPKGAEVGGVGPSVKPAGSAATAVHAVSSGAGVQKALPRNGETKAGQRPRGKRGGAKNKKR